MHAKQILPQNSENIELIKNTLEKLKQEQIIQNSGQIIDFNMQARLPAEIAYMFVEILNAIANGQGVTVIPQNAELTTVEAADILKVSRPFLIKLLENGEIPYRTVGKHRRILMKDVIAYKDDIDSKRREVLDELVRLDQENGMGY
jgi:excisionase family DNA binding protein